MGEGIFLNTSTSAENCLERVYSRSRSLDLVLPCLGRKFEENIRNCSCLLEKKQGNPCMCPYSSKYWHSSRGATWSVYKPVFRPLPKARHTYHDQSSLRMTEWADASDIGGNRASPQEICFLMSAGWRLAKPQRSNIRPSSQLGLHQYQMNLGTKTGEWKPLVRVSPKGQTKS